MLNVADDIRVLDADLWIDGVAVARDGLPPYRFAVEAPPAPATIVIGATARDFGGNRGEAPLVEVQVTEGIGTTSVVGSIVGEDGVPVAGASVFTSLGGSGISAADGSFRIDGLPATVPSLVAFGATSTGSGELRGRSDSVTVVANGLTDAGPIVLHPVGLPYPGPRSSIGYLPDEPDRLDTGDFDRDGLLDLAVAPYSTGNVAVLLGRGDGSFEEALELPGGSNPRDVAVADLNQDGFLDLVVPDSTLGMVQIYLGQGDGTFGDPSDFSSGIDPADVAVGDVDRDQVPDLVLAGYSTGELVVMLGRGDGTVEPPYSLAIATGPDRLELADFDADGNLDIVTEENLTILFGNGDGTFQGPIELSPENPSTHEGRVYDHEVGDLNGDGLPDIFAVVADVFLNGDGAIFLSRGDGTFSKHILTVTGFPKANTRSALGDFNADGLLDAVVRYREYSGPFLVIEPLLGDGTGDFQVGEDIYAGDLSGSSRSPVLLADFDGDGLDDLVAGGKSGVSVFSATGDGHFQVYLREQQQFSYAEGHILTADLDVDGLDDLVVSKSYGLLYYPRQADGSFGDFVNLTLNHVVSDMLAADLTGDGAPELVAVGDHTVSIYLNAGDGTFVGPEERVMSQIVVGVVASELTGDGYTDLSIRMGGRMLGLLANDGAGSFPSVVQYALQGVPRGLAAIDFDLDGDSDLAVATDDPLGITILSNDGNGVLTSAAELPLTLLGPPSAVDSPESLTSGDFNDDGYPDLAVGMDGYKSSVSVYIGQQGGQFLVERVFPVGEDPVEILVSDVDLDGVNDLLTVNYDTSDVSWLRGLGDGTFSAEQRFATGIGPNDATLIDLNLDGLPDLAVSVNHGSNPREVDFLLHQ